MSNEAYYEIKSPNLKRDALQELAKAVTRKVPVPGLSDVARGLFLSKDASEHKDTLISDNGIKLGLFLAPLNVKALSILEQQKYKELRKFFILHQASREILNVLFPGTTREIIEKTRRAHRVAAPARASALEEKEEAEVFKTFYRLYKTHKNDVRTLYRELQKEHLMYNITTLFTVTSTLPEMQHYAGIIDFANKNGNDT